MLRRAKSREESSCIQHRISNIFEPAAVKLAASGFYCIILGSLAAKLDSGAARLYLKLFDRLYRNA